MPQDVSPTWQTINGFSGIDIELWQKEKDASIASKAYRAQALSWQISEGVSQGSIMLQEDIYLGAVKKGRIYHILPELRRERKIGSFSILLHAADETGERKICDLGAIEFPALYGESLFANTQYAILFPEGLKRREDFEWIVIEKGSRTLKANAIEALIDGKRLVGFKNLTLSQSRRPAVFVMGDHMPYEATGVALTSGIIEMSTVQQDSWESWQANKFSLYQPIATSQTPDIGLLQIRSNYNTLSLRNVSITSMQIQDGVYKVSFVAQQAESSPGGRGAALAYNMPPNA